LPETSWAVRAKSLAVFYMLPRYLKALKAAGTEHVHAHFATYPTLMAWLLFKFLGIPFSFTAHAHDIYVDRSLFMLAASDAFRVVTISQFNKNLMYQWLPELGDSHVAVVRCGIDVGRFSFRENPIAPGKRLAILSVGRLSGIKGFPVLFQGLRRLKEAGADFFCTVVGDGPDRAALEALRLELELQDHLQLIGSRSSSQVAELMRQADLFVLACDRDPHEGHDGIPVVFMEAMACGVPVIGTSLSGIPELIRHGETGLCAAPHDAEALKEQMLFYLNNLACVETMRFSGRTCIEKEFNIVNNARQLRGIFQASLHRHCPETSR